MFSKIINFTDDKDIDFIKSSNGTIISFILIMIIKLFSLKFLKTCLISTNNLEFMNER